LIERGPFAYHCLGYRARSPFQTRETTMSLSRKAFLGALLATCLATPAFAQAESWDLKERMFYVVDPNGQMRIMPMGERDMTPLMKRAKRVPRGTVFFMRDGQLYTMQGRGMMFDRAGNWKTR
jgi:hypothetical protein